MIEIKNVSKRYNKYIVPYGSLKSLVLHYKEYRNQIAKIDKLNVIQDLSIEIKKGEILCITGKNGSGKSTLAKIIAGTVDPDTGSVNVEGRIVPFLELGVAFNPELSGYDNVFLNGVLLGLSRDYLKKNIEKIFKYAEVEEFINTPVKYYSSGMQVRLAYSVGMHAYGDIYIFDEILAVGDVNFQKKCFDSFGKLIKEGKTIILITHDGNIVRQYATKVLHLDNGNYTILNTHDEIMKLNI